MMSLMRILRLVVFAGGLLVSAALTQAQTVTAELTPTTIDATPGVTVGSTTYPRANMTKLAGQKTPTAVFGSDFTILVQLRVSPNAAAGDLNVPAKFRYQACNDKTCYPPATPDTRWTLHVSAH
jgi:thiol:disulfide interchange protein DsbD